MKFLNAIEKKCASLQELSLFLVRVVVGVTFAMSGWGKLNNLERTIGFFASIGIPAASVQAPFVALVEFLMGLCVLLGVRARVAALPLIATMIVALITAHRDEITGFDALFGLSPFLYAVMLLVVAAFGAGRWSVDGRRGRG